MPGSGCRDDAAHYPQDVDYARFVDQLTEQAAAMRAAAVAAGPDASVPTCPEWTVRRLVRHMAKLHNWAGRSLGTPPDGERPSPDSPPADWDELLSWWDKELTGFVDLLRSREPAAPAWTFATGPRVAAFWARRQAHETAIHRLDAEHAAAGSAEADAVPALVFDSEFAADGIDEVLHVGIAPVWARERPAARGTVLLHAADAGRAWLVRLQPGEIEIGPAADQPALDADASIVGTADAVYRAAWGRPSHAVTGGDRQLLGALRSP
jgi:uncharacterized protein (TIGR03083 family)